MPFLADRVLDLGLAVLDLEATHFYLCTSEPTTFAGAQAARLASRALAAADIGAPSARTPSGRRVTVAVLTGGTVTVTGTASHYAIVDETNSRLLAANPLASSQVVTNGNTFATTGTFDIGIPAP